MTEKKREPLKLATTTEDFSRFCEDYLDCVKLVHAAGFQYIDLSMYKIQENDALLIQKNRRSFSRDERLLHPQLFMQNHLKRLMHDIGVYLMEAYQEI